MVSRAAHEPLAGDADPRVSLDEVETWSEHTTGAFGTRVFSGGHFYLVDHAQQVIGVVSDSLTRCTAG